MPTGRASIGGPVWYYGRSVSSIVVGGMSFGNWIAITISGCALAFTTGTFWWMNWRRGTLHAWPPRSFAFADTGGQVLIVLPLVFYNDGPTPIVVLNLQLRLSGPSGTYRLSFEATRPGVQPLPVPDDGREMATAIPVRGREAQLICCEFSRKPGGVVSAANGWEASVEARLGAKRKWMTLLESFPLAIDERALRQSGHYVAYDNDPIASP